MKRLSIIIPAYNVELYLKKCLLSCLEQDIHGEDYEIIVINDGSLDGSLEIANRIASEYSNVIVISQPNQGLSAARNKGLSVATGEYVWFVDSDDWIETNCLAEMIKAAADVDVLALNYIWICDNHSVESFLPVESTGRALLFSSFHQQAQFYLFRKSFLFNNNLFFYNGIYHEDFEFTPRMLFYADKLKVYLKPVYYYFQRENSISRNINPKRAFDLLTVANSLDSFCKKIVPDSDKIPFYNLISLGLNNAFSIIIQTDEQTQRKWLLELKQRGYLLNALNNSNFKRYKFEGILFSLLPFYLYIYSYRIMQLFNFRCKKNK